MEREREREREPERERMIGESMLQETGAVDPERPAPPQQNPERKYQIFAAEKANQAAWTTKSTV